MKEQQRSKALGKSLTPTLRRKLEAYVEKKGEAAAVEELGISRQTIFRAIAGRPIQRGTISVVETALDGGGGA